VRGVGAQAAQRENPATTPVATSAFCSPPPINQMGKKPERHFFLGELSNGPNPGFPATAASVSPEDTPALLAPLPPNSPRIGPSQERSRANARKRARKKC